MRERSRSRPSGAETDDTSKVDPAPRKRAEEFEISPVRVITPQEAAAKAQMRAQTHQKQDKSIKPKSAFGSATSRMRAAPRAVTDRQRPNTPTAKGPDTEEDNGESDAAGRERVVTSISTFQRDIGKEAKHPEPVFGDSEEVRDEDPARESESESNNKDEAKLVSNKVERELDSGMMLALTVVASGRQLRGSQVLKAVTASGLSYGKMGIFHYTSPTRPTPRPLFSLANVVEPGTFNLAQMEELATPGLILFANVSRPEDAMSTFNTMLEKARQLAAALDASVCDGRRSTLSKLGIEHIYGEIGEFQRRSRLAQAAHA
jgi:cell division protein ZipA